MPNRVQQLKQLARRYEKQARAQIVALSDRATPQAIQGVRQLRRTLNANLLKLERALAAQARRR